MNSTKVHELTIDGMHCDACELFMEKTLEKQLGVIKVNADAKTQKVKVLLAEGTDEVELDRKISDQIEKQGYKIVDTVIVEEGRLKKQVLSLVLAITIFGVYFLLQKLNLTSLFTAERLTYPAIFILGVLASLSTCMAVVGGISMTLSSKFAVEHRNKASIVFHLARLIGFVLLGGVIGFLGKIVVLSAAMGAVLKVLVGAAMFVVGADLVGIKLPKLHFPKQIAAALGVFEDRDGWTNALLLGVATFFLPCAFTQSMQLYAVSTGSFVIGALVMGVFALGTLPVLSLVSLGAASGVSRINTSVFGYAMGYLIMLFALLNILSALGSFGVFPLLQF